MSRGRVAGNCRTCGQPRPMGDALGRAYRRAYWRLWRQMDRESELPIVKARRKAVLARVRRAAVEGQLSLADAIWRFERIVPRRTP